MTGTGNSESGKPLTSHEDTVASVDEALPNLGDKFEPLGLIGGGGMGYVVRARHRELEREVAVKLIAPPEEPEQLDLPDDYDD